MILGTSSFTYGWAITYYNKINNVAAFEQILLDKTLGFGLKCMQIGDNLPVHTFDSQRLNDLKHSTAGSGIRLEIGARGLTDANLERYLMLADHLASPLLRFVVDGPGFEPDTETIVRTIKNSLSYLKEKGINLGIENHDRFKVKTLAGMMESIGDWQVGICLDCVNSIGAGEGLEYVAGILAPYTINLHIKDFTVVRLPHQMGFTVQGCPAGKGLTELDLLMEKLGRYHRCESAILEQWVVPEGTTAATIKKEEQWANESMEYLKHTNYFKF